MLYKEAWIYWLGCWSSTLVEHLYYLTCICLILLTQYTDTDTVKKMCLTKHCCLKGLRLKEGAKARAVLSCAIADIWQSNIAAACVGVCFSLDVGFIVGLFFCAWMDVFVGVVMVKCCSGKMLGGIFFALAVIAIHCDNNMLW